MRSRGSGSGSHDDLLAPALAAAERAGCSRDRRATCSSARRQHAPGLGLAAAGGGPRRPSTRRGVFCRNAAFSSRALVGGDFDRRATGREDVVGEAAHALERHRLVARLPDRRRRSRSRRDGRAGCRSRRRPARRATSPWAASSTPAYSSTSASSSSKMHEFWCTMRGISLIVGEQRRVIRMVVHDDGRVGAGAVQLGVQEHRGRDVPRALDDRCRRRRAAGCRRPAPRPTRCPTGCTTCRRRVSAHVMWPDRFSRQPSWARMRSAHASCCGTVSSPADAGTGTGLAHEVNGTSRDVLTARDTCW